MDFDDTQFQGAGPAGNGFDDFTAGAPPISEPSQPVIVENGGGLDDFFGAPVPAVPSVGLPVPTEVLNMGFTAPEAFIAGADDDPFFQHYTPPPPPPPPPAPEAVDPRVEWRKQNNEQLKKKDAEESTAKQQLKEVAAKHLAKFYEVRTTTLTTRKANNRKSEAHQKEVEVPATGTSWEKINALVNLNNANHQKDIARYKAVLIACKAKNVAIRA